MTEKRTLRNELLLKTYHNKLRALIVLYRLVAGNSLELKRKVDYKNGAG